jgi:hypothetical protein
MNMVYQEGPHANNCLYIFIHTLYITVCQANSYQCSKLTPEDGQGTPETCSVAKIK